jgi:hypothetical protein
MSASNFDPSSVLQKERRIVRKQSDHSAGMFLDGPARNVPENGIRELKNFTNRGYLEGRGGSRRWSNTKLPNLKTTAGVERNYYTASKSANLITVTAGWDFTEKDVGSFFVFKNGILSGIDRHYKITQVDIGNNILVVNDVLVEHTSTALCSVRGQVNGLYPHKTLRKIILHIDRRVFVADAYASSWEESYCISYKKPHNSLSKIVEHENYAFLINSNGLFKIDLVKSPSLFFMMNSMVPTIRVTGSGSIGELTPYCRNYTYSMSRLNGIGERNRETLGVYIECESGTVVYDPDHKDYGSVFTAYPISSDHPVSVGSLTVPCDDVVPTEAERHWTHYSVYAPLDTGFLGFDAVKKVANQSELFIWVNDIPVCKAFELSIDVYGGIAVTQNVLSDYDKYCSIKSSDGLVFEIYDITNLTSGLVSDSDGTVYSGGTRGSTGYAIGANDVIGFTQLLNTVTLVSGTMQFASGDVGKCLYCSNGKYKYITKVNSISSVEVNDSETISTTIYAAMNPTSRKFCDTVSDEVPGLRSRIKAWPLNQRAWEPLPPCNIGTIASSFLLVARSGEKDIFYSEFPKGYEHLVGYYNSLDQHEIFPDGIIDIVSHKESVVIRCFHSTHEMDTSSVIQQTIEDIGESHMVISSKSIIDPNIGCMDFGGNSFMDQSTEMVITSEPAMRTFSNRAYGENVAKDRISEMLRRMQTSYASGYHQHIGYIFWGNTE